MCTVAAEMTAEVEFRCTDTAQCQHTEIIEYLMDRSRCVSQHQLGTSAWSDTWR